MTLALRITFAALATLATLALPTGDTRHATGGPVLVYDRAVYGLRINGTPLAVKYPGFDRISWFRGGTDKE